MNKRLVVVLGMHRSGTSVVTRALKVMGVGLGSDLLPSQKDNRKGFWEDVELVDFNEEILTFLGQTWHSLSEISEEDIGMLITQGFDSKALDWLNKRMENHPVFGCKDPRMVKLLPFWKKIFDQCDADVCYVLAIRNPLSVAQSLKKRDGFDLEKSYLMWIGHVLTSLKYTINDPRVLIDYDMLLDEPAYEILRMNHALELAVDKSKLKEFTDDFLETELRHSIYSLLDINNDNFSYNLMNDIYSKLLDVVAKKIELNDPAFIEMIHKWNSDFRSISSILKMVDKAAADRDGKIAGLNQAVADRDGKIAGLNQAVADRDGKIAGLNEAVANRDAKIAELNNLVTEYRESKSWKLTSPLRWSVHQIKRLVHCA